MKQFFMQSIDEAKKMISKIDDCAHGLIHTASVVSFSLIIAKTYPTIDPEIIELAAWRHDIGRLYDKNHEQISADMAYRSLKKNNIDDSICQKVYDAILFHKWSMSPKTLEGEIIRDADKLDFIGIERRKYCLQQNNIAALEDILPLLPRLRNELLHLAISKKIFDEYIITFKRFVQLLDDTTYSEIKMKIINYHL